VELGINTRNAVYPTMMGHTLPNGYAVEMAIPWGDLGVVPQANLTIGFDVGVNDDDRPCSLYERDSRDGEIRWSGDETNFETTANFGELTLSFEKVDSETGTDSESDSGIETDTHPDSETDTGFSTDDVDAGLV
jgi:hypothetical protein